MIFCNSLLPFYTWPRASTIWKSIRSSTVPCSTTKFETSRNKSDKLFICTTISSISCFFTRVFAGSADFISSISSYSCYSLLASPASLSVLSSSLRLGRRTSPYTPYSLAVLWTYSRSTYLRRFAASFNLLKYAYCTLSAMAAWLWSALSEICSLVYFSLTSHHLRLV